MHINGKEYRTVWYKDKIIYLIDQPRIPHSFEIVELKNEKEVYKAIKDMIVRGAPAIGATGCFGLAQFIENYDKSISNFESDVKKIAEFLKSARPTAYDLTHGIDHILEKIKDKEIKNVQKIAKIESQNYADKSVAACKKIGEYGNKLIKDGDSISTHCNAGALATVDYGTALAPMRIAKEDGKKIFVYVDETRPRAQGSRLTAFELEQEKIPYAIITDNATGYFLRSKKINLIITGTDRVAKNGDIANKIGTYEKAVVAHENNIPFYIAAPISTIDFACPTGEDIPIEERPTDEVLHMWGWSDNGKFERVRIAPKNAKALNPAFDITPAKYITAIITEKGIFRPEEIKNLENL